MNDTRMALPSFLSPPLLIRAEGAALAGLSGYLYAEYGRSWVLFVLLFLAPDLSMLAYLVNGRIGAATYNIVHTLVWPALLIAIAVSLDNAVMLSIALTWVAHIGVDRLVGYGLKYPSDFKDTHIQRL